MKRTTIIESVTLLYVILFLYTGVSKLMDYSVFREQLLSSTVLPAFVKPVATLLPMLEFTIVVLLIVPKWQLKGLYASFVLMIIFTEYIIALLCFSETLPCSCGGIIELLSWKQHLFFNVTFIGLAIWAIFLLKTIKKESQQQWLSISRIQ